MLFNIYRDYTQFFVIIYLNDIFYCILELNQIYLSDDTYPILIII
jgi:hypothetical protein